MQKGSSFRGESGNVCFRFGLDDESEVLDVLVERVVEGIAHSGGGGEGDASSK